MIRKIKRNSKNRTRFRTVGKFNEGWYWYTHIIARPADRKYTRFSKRRK